METTEGGVEVIVINNYAKMLIEKTDEKTAKIQKLFQAPIGIDPNQKRAVEKREQREEISPKELKKFVEKKNSLKPIGVEREIIGEKRADNYTPQYYKTEDWKLRSKVLIEKAGGKCSKCDYKGKGLTMHHLTYAYKPHTEPEEVLECLCQDCHYLKHEINKIVHGGLSKNIDNWGYDFEYRKKLNKKRRKEITRKIIKLAPWILEDKRKKLCYLRVIGRQLEEFLNLKKLRKIREETQSLTESNRVSALVIKSYWVSTSGDTREHKVAMKKTFRLSWKGFKKQWEGTFISKEELNRFVKYCTNNEIEHATGENE